MEYLRKTRFLRRSYSFSRIRAWTRDRSLCWHLTNILLTRTSARRILVLVFLLFPTEYCKHSNPICLWSRSGQSHTGHSQFWVRQRPADKARDDKRNRNDVTQSSTKRKHRHGSQEVESLDYPSESIWPKSLSDWGERGMIREIARAGIAGLQCDGEDSLTIISQARIFV